MSNQHVNTCVFYDGACPLCSREVKQYKNLIRKEGSDDDIDWIDISKSQQELKAEGIKYQDAMKLIHVKDKFGVHQVGIDAIFTIWDRLPYYRRISGFLQKFPTIKPFLSKSYAFFADHRMKLKSKSSRKKP